MNKVTVSIIIASLLIMVGFVLYYVSSSKKELSKAVAKKEEAPSNVNISFGIG